MSCSQDQEETFRILILKDKQFPERRVNIEDNKHCNKEQLEFLLPAHVCFKIRLAQTTENQVGLALVLALCHFTNARPTPQSYTSTVWTHIVGHTLSVC